MKANFKALLCLCLASLCIGQHFPDYYYTDYQTLFPQQQVQAPPAPHPQRLQPRRVYCSVPSGDFPHLADPGCKTFYHCENYIPSIRTCDVGLLFDYDNNSCVDYTRIKCEQQRQMYALRIETVRQQYDASNSINRQQRVSPPVSNWNGYPQTSYPQYRKPIYQQTYQRQAYQPVLAYNHLPAITPPTPGDVRDTVVIDLTAQPATNQTQCALIERMANQYFAAIVQHATGQQCLSGGCSVPYLTVRC